MIIFFNLVGLVMLAIAFGIAFGFRWLLSLTGDGLPMIIAGTLLITIDTRYRMWRRGTLQQSNQGGSLFFIPIWLWGCLWSVIGVVYLLRGV